MDGGNANSSEAGVVYSASVPKLLVHQGRLYLYWTAVRSRTNGEWLDIATRGIELEVKSTGALGVRQVHGTIRPNDSRSIEVWGLVENARENSVADVFQVYSDGVSVYAIAAIGGWDKASFPGWQTRSPGDSRSSRMCLTPLSAVTGCYRLAIARSTAPLERRGFNVSGATRRIADNVLPANPQEYARLFTGVDGRPRLMGLFKPQRAAPDQGKLDVSEGMWSFALPLPASSAAVEQLITHYYTSILERAPDAGGLAHWKNLVTQRQSLGLDAKPVFRDIAQSFLTSPEYTNKRTTDSQFVHTLYRTFFQRNPDPGGLSYWLGRLSSGASRLQVMRGFVDSAEFTTFMQGMGF